MNGNWITFASLGLEGRLGNQIFQFAALCGLAMERGMFVKVPQRDIDLYNCFRMPSGLFLNSVDEYASEELCESHYHYDKSLSSKIVPQISLRGYFQSYRYFESSWSVISHLLVFRDEVRRVAQMHDIANRSVSIHIRRGDYLYSNESFPVLPLEYYQKAVRLFPGHKFYVFTDDRGWANSCDFFATINATIVQGTDRFQDLFLMSQCAHNIIANSSYSWWAAWLNRNPGKIVIAPKIWLGGNLTHYDTSDLIPPTWLQL